MNNIQQRRRLIKFNRIMNEKTKELLKDIMTFHHESGSVTTPDVEDIQNVYDIVMYEVGDKLKELQHFKDSSVGLFCTDKKPKDLFLNSIKDQFDVIPIYSSKNQLVENVVAHFDKLWKEYCDRIFFQLK